MAVEWRLLPEARDDLDDAYAWYEKQRSGLGEDVMACVEACLDSVAKMPTTHERVYKDYRRALVRRFPYAVYYSFDDQTLWVHAIFHTARKPARWRKRLQ